MTAGDLLDAQRRIQVDFDEWPMLRLTFAQAARLWTLPHDICLAAMENLVHADYLQQRNGVYLRRALGLGGRRAGVRQAPASAVGRITVSNLRNPSTTESRTSCEDSPQHR